MQHYGSMGVWGGGRSFVNVLIIQLGVGVGVGVGVAVGLRLGLEFVSGVVNRLIVQCHIAKKVYRRAGENLNRELSRHLRVGRGLVWTNDGDSTATLKRAAI